MGRTFNYGGEKDGEEALAMLATIRIRRNSFRPSWRGILCRIIRRRRLWSGWRKSYESSGGDIRSVLKTMIYSPEFWSKETYRAKVKTPFELVASTARALDADVTISLPLAMWVGRMGEPLFLMPAAHRLFGQGRNVGEYRRAAEPAEFCAGVFDGTLAGANVDLPAMFGEDASKDPEMALSRAVDFFLGGQVAPTTRQTLETRLNDPQILQAKLDDPVKQVNEGLLSGLVLGTPEFQRR